MNHPCYTCRRRRIQCDQSGSPCAKCEKSGFECFQQRPLRWVKGVTLRSKFHDSVLRPSAQTTHVYTQLPTEVAGTQAVTKHSALKNKPIPCPHATCSLHYESSSCTASTAGDMTIKRSENTLVITSPRGMSDQAISHLDTTSRYYLDYCKHYFTYNPAQHRRRVKTKNINWVQTMTGYASSSSSRTATATLLGI